jgi:hypothetical protein
MKIESSVFGTTTYTGTASEFVAKGLKLNSQPIDAVGLSIMHKYGVVQDAGFAEKDAKTRGRAPMRYRLSSKSGFEIGA